MREALAIGALQRARLLAGQGGLDNVIEYVDVMEVPDARFWLRPRLLIVTTAYAIKNNVPAQVELIEEMARVGAAGLVVKPGRFLGSVAESVIEAADRLNVPVLAVPDDIPFVEITHPLLAAIVNRRVEQLEHSEKVHRRLTEAALEAQDFQGVAAALFSLLERRVWITDSAGRVQAACPEEPLPFEAERLQEAGPDGLNLEASAPSGPLPLAVVPFGHGGRREGFLVVESGRALSDLDWISLRHGVTACSLIAARQRAVREREWQLRREVFWKLVEDRSGDLGLAAERARYLGIPAGVPVAVLVVRFVAGVSGLSFKTVGAETIRGDEDTAVVADHLEMACFMGFRQWAADFPGAAAHLKHKARRVVERISGAIPIGATAAGVSLPAESPVELGERYRQAKLAAQIAEAVMGPGSLACWSDVEPYYLLAGQAEKWADVCRRVLGPLAEARGDEDEVLLRTLRAYLACGGNAAEAARRLFVHRNTLYYRLRKLRRLLHRDLDDPHERFLLELVVRSRELMGRIPT